MINFFNSLYNSGKGMPALPGWSYVQDGLERETANVIKQYRSSAFAVKTDHELVKVLHGFAVSTSQDLADYYRKVDAISMNLAQQLGYTSSINQGRMFSGIFFAKGSKEVLIAHDSEFDPQEVTDKWMDVQAVKVLRHNFDQLDFFPYNGTIRSNRVNVFSINMPMLAVQYRAYRQWQANGGQVEDTGRNSIYHFIYSYVINNIHRSSVPMAIFNRLVKIGMGKQVNQNQYRHPFYTTDYTERTDRILNAYDWIIKNNRVNMNWLLGNCPMPHGYNGLDLMRFPDIRESRQVNWASYLARIQVVLYLLSINPEATQSLDRTRINQLKYMLGVYLRDNTIRSAVAPDVFNQEKDVIENLLASL